MTAPHSFRLLSYDDLAALPAVRPLAGPYLPEGGLGVFVAAPGTGKTFIALDLALSVATGTPFLGEPVEAGPVVYVSGEGRSGLLQRVEAWFQTHPNVDRANVPIKFVVEPVNLLDASNVDGFLAAIDATEVTRAVLVALDTLARCFAGGDENSTRDMGTAVAACDRIRSATGGAVLALHHPPKGGMGARGSGVLAGAVDTEMHLAADDQGVLRLTIAKQKDGPAHTGVSLRLDEVRLPDDPNGRPRTSCVVRVIEPSQGSECSPRAPRLTQTARRALDALVAATPGGLTYSAWRQACGLADTSMRNARKSLLKRTLVAQEGDRYTIIDRDREATATYSQTTANGCNVAAPSNSHQPPPPCKGGGGGGSGRRGGGGRGGGADGDHCLEDSSGAAHETDWSDLDVVES